MFDFCVHCSVVADLYEEMTPMEMGIINVMGIIVSWYLLYLISLFVGKSEANCGFNLVRLGTQVRGLWCLHIHMFLSIILLL